MKLTILGCGTYQPELTRHASGYLLEIGQQKIIFDFGRGALDQLLKLGVNYYDLDYIFISHTHADHCAELGPFLHIALAEPSKGKFRKNDITIYGPLGLKKTIYYLLRAFGLDKHRPLHSVFIKEIKDESQIKNRAWTITSYAVNHSKPRHCLAYRIKSSGKIFCYSGDTGDCSGLRKAAAAADLAVVETSEPKIIKSANHLNGDQVGKIARDCQVKKLILTHIAPYYLKNFNVIKEVKENYQGPVGIAKDLMKLAL